MCSKAASIGLKSCNDFLAALILDALREYDVELDDEVAARSVSLHLESVGGISDDIACESAWHTLSGTAELRLRCDHIGWRDKDLSIIEGVNSDRLQLEGIDKIESVGVDQIISFALKVSKRLLRELDYQVGWVGTKGFMATSSEDKFGLG